MKTHLNTLIANGQAKLDATLNPLIDRLPDSKTKQAIEQDIEHIKTTINDAAQKLSSEGREQAAEEMLKQLTKSDLPEMPAWQARSFWAVTLAAAVAFGNVLGYDVNELVAKLGFTSIEDAATDISVLLMFALTGWAWFERKSPKFKLVLPFGKKH